MKKPIFKEGKKYTFRDYFYLPNPVEDIVAELGYSYSLKVLQLPTSESCNVESVNNLKRTYYNVLPKIFLNSETAKREFLIAPVLFKLAKETDSKINVEYPIDVSELLNGYLDYLIRYKQELIVIEAKKGDINKGFNQLAAELIAWDQYEEEGGNILYGVVTIGEMWVFSMLDRKNKKITRDMHNYTIPEDVEDIFRILVGIIESSV
ncbi:hypothetical protein H206_01152 [Candidatus Electrothrix aarhusensis]|uniref:Type I restriction enzyme R protein N terminus (HSDR_N) n=1 Tax=Candidatus Electrothrix aarhusensis TaxID=1859131 RepID=A0A3S3U943_9BACT|nr:hypothetical protein H206_01152 [Candidatus Electrothrix aarhusensis]